jgi:anti-sigma regulatory factor (Ser/Thr protein kinase)
MTKSSGRDSPAALRLALACDLAQVRPVAQAVHRFLAAQCCAESDLMDCRLALVEACNNAVQYAEENARHMPVGVEIICRPQEIEMRVTDHTPGFEWPERAPLADAEHEHGRGLYLIQSLMDFSHFTCNGAENVLVLRKKRGQNRTPDSEKSG